MTPFKIRHRLRTFFGRGSEVTSAPIDLGPGASPGTNEDTHEAGAPEPSDAVAAPPTPAEPALAAAVATPTSVPVPEPVAVVQTAPAVPAGTLVASEASAPPADEPQAPAPVPAPAERVTTPANPAAKTRPPPKVKAKATSKPATKATTTAKSSAAAVATAAPAAAANTSSPVAASPAALAATDSPAKVVLTDEEKQAKHWQKTRTGMLKWLVEQGGRVNLATMHDHSERRYFIAHRRFSDLMTEFTNEGLVEYTRESGLVELTEAGRTAE